ncbi:MAG: Cof-type HAD-IIB family hydrolase [Acetatifactor sp.]|nr:Cof-type HAD-IIB family hydrolase [Acetatifactor sp.]MDE7114149.1 Cof-type HAD-IIB family hydrolase [Acetatifactor sp.]
MMQQKPQDAADFHKVHIVDKVYCVDLHVHSTCSDGTLSPTQLVDYAMEKHLLAFALTDHDTVQGLPEALAHAAQLREQYRQNGDTSGACTVPEIIPGVELSTEYHGRDIHVVGLFIDPQNQKFQTYLTQFIESRDLRNQKMCARLRDAGIDISCEALVAEFPNSVITRAHYAKYLLNHGYIKSMKEAFERYVGDHCPCYVPREKVTPAQAVEMILEADGVPVLAHPLLYGMGADALDALVAELKAVGLMGIEALYSTYSPADERQVRALAAKYHLLISGGSDFHGANKPGLDLAVGYGGLCVPASVLEDIRSASKKLLFTDMDGTLLLNDSTVSPAMGAALNRMTAAGHHLILSSGRPLPSILEVREKEHLNYPNMLILSNNGALVYDCDKRRNILEYRICAADIAHIVAAAQERGLHIHGYTDTEIVCRGMNAELAFYTRRIHMPLKCVEDIAAALPEGCFKLQAIHLTDKSVLEDFRQSLLDFCGDRIQMIFSNEQYLEILPAEAGKGNALRFIAEFLHAPLSRTFACGDAENDISMLQAAGTGVAMANAPEAVKKAAHIVTTKSNDEDGLLEILEKYFLP